MTEIWLTVLGVVAATLTSAAGAPQIIKSWKTKSTKDLSLAMIVLFLAGVTLWTIYGIARKDVAILYAQGVAYVFYISLLILKLKFK
ncbi:MAG: SemiSWEET transporter [Candidatus Wildermuthbacteria bacterium]|nr:SemiSWEET transporter [Candidatus Wildermuthbacteria bacterium]